MCTNGINVGQFELMIAQIDDHLKLERRWSHNLAHQAGDAGFSGTAEKLHAAMALIDEARALLDEANDALEDDAQQATGVEVSFLGASS